MVPIVFFVMVSVHVLRRDLDLAWWSTFSLFHCRWGSPGTPPATWSYSWNRQRRPRRCSIRSLQWLWFRFCVLKLVQLWFKFCVGWLKIITSCGSKFLFVRSRSQRFLILFLILSFLSVQLKFSMTCDLHDLLVFSLFGGKGLWFLCFCSDLVWISPVLCFGPGFSQYFLALLVANHFWSLDVWLIVWVSSVFF